MLLHTVSSCDASQNYFGVTYHLPLVFSNTVLDCVFVVSLCADALFPLLVNRSAYIFWEKLAANTLSIFFFSTLDRIVFMKLNKSLSYTLWNYRFFFSMR